MSAEQVVPFLAPPNAVFGFLGKGWCGHWWSQNKCSEQVVALRFGITSALPSIPQGCIWSPWWRVGVGTGDPEMSAEQVVALCFAITGALPSTPQRCIGAPRWRVGVGTGDPKMKAEQVVPLRFGS